MRKLVRRRIQKIQLMPHYFVGHQFFQKDLIGLFGSMHAMIELMKIGR